ncbi:phasin family protein [Sphingomonas insulae]|uniref:Phasin domain-containing protein n=1 Tax=Sphingomonas insulae TaxID=424800 RepID=A0ABN1HL79_9SPHN|nr:phasin family protein [Sphingomonas insulae]NIJ30276.1 phasin family protein [Sphingomonas insulae]
MDGTVPKPPVKSGKSRPGRPAGAAATPVSGPRIKPTGKQPAPVAKPVPAAKAMEPVAVAAAPAPVPAPAAVPVLAEPDVPAIPAALAATPRQSVPEPVEAAPIAAPAPIAPPAVKEVIMETIENVTAQTQTAFNDATSQAKGAVEKGQKMFEEANEFGKGNIEALVESSKIAARGFEAMSQEAATYAKKTFEEATAAAKTLSSVKSPTEFMKLQSDYARAAFDAMVQQTSRNTEAMLKLAGEVVQPLSNRAALAAEKMKVVA